MQSSITLNNIFALFGTMIILGSIPSVSVLVVSARSAAFGFIHGVFTTLGIVLGDIVLILIAILGVALLARTMGPLFAMVKYLGAAYLIWLGIMLWRSRATTSEAESVTGSTLISSFMTGLLITLGDQKAVLFYLGFFPAFFDLSTISYIDTGIVIAIATVSIIVPKLIYAYFAGKTSLLKSSRVYRGINMLAAGILIAVGVFIIVTV